MAGAPVQGHEMFARPILEPFKWSSEATGTTFDLTRRHFIAWMAIALADVE
jgi:hypothetical protein